MKLEGSKLELEKIFFYFSEDEWHGNLSESVWAERLNENTFKMKNSPFYVFGISFNDVVEANLDSSDGRLKFEKVIKTSGHSTYRIYLIDSENLDFSKYWAPMEKIGCSYEQYSKNFYTIDVPPKTDIHDAYNLLEAGLNNGIWDFEEGHCGHAVD